MGPSEWNAKRFQQKPLRQPSYSFRNVPRCPKDLKGCSLQRVTNREHFLETMAEMVLLCNEAMRLSREKMKNANNSKSSSCDDDRHSNSKPLSLEYIADRLDVDDPLDGYLIRCPEGRLQGFVTVTTFTNWQKTFRWDSMHESAYAYDDEEQALAMMSGERKYDSTGILAEELQSTIRCGDPYNEGIIWPRIAEITLLGGLGCGKTLVQLVVDELERMKPSATQNYDYVVLQATHNSIPFYEHMGFVRVGAITEDKDFEKKQEKQSCSTNDSSSNNDDDDTGSTTTIADVEDTVIDEKRQNNTEKKNQSKEDEKEDDGEEEETKSEVVSSALMLYRTKNVGETPRMIARKLGIDVWDIIFLNHCAYPGISPGSRLVVKTIVQVPDKKKAIANATTAAIRRKKLKFIANEDPLEAPLWYIAKENDTPRTIAKMFKGVRSSDVVKGNIDRLPDLVAGSRLKEGTRIKLSHFDVPDDKHVPYCHWTYPDDEFESGEPSYMMVRRLNRRPPTNQRSTSKSSTSTSSFLESLAVPISDYVPTTLVLPPSPVSSKKKKKITDFIMDNKQTMQHPDRPKSPTKPLNAFQMFCEKQKQLLKEDSHHHKQLKNGKQHKKKQQLAPEELSTALKIAWKELSMDEKSLYEKASATAKAKYEREKETYQSQLAQLQLAESEKNEDNNSQEEQEEDENTEEFLFNKVVKLKPAAEEEGSGFKYWFVLTFIPDLKWCHLAPMRMDGQFGLDQPQIYGRPKWKLVDESAGKELDISSRMVIPVASRMMLNSDDADLEEWDILEEKVEKQPPPPPPPLSSPPLSSPPPPPEQATTTTKTTTATTTTKTTTATTATAATTTITKATTTTTTTGNLVPKKSVVKENKKTSKVAKSNVFMSLPAPPVQSKVATKKASVVVASAAKLRQPFDAARRPLLAAQFAESSSTPMPHSAQSSIPMQSVPSSIPMQFGESSTPMQFAQSSTPMQFAQPTPMHFTPTTIPPHWPQQQGCPPFVSPPRKEAVFDCNNRNRHAWMNGSTMRPMSDVDASFAAGKSANLGLAAEQQRRQQLLQSGCNNNPSIMNWIYPKNNSNRKNNVVLPGNCNSRKSSDRNIPPPQGGEKNRMSPVYVGNQLPSKQSSSKQKKLIRISDSSTAAAAAAAKAKAKAAAAEAAATAVAAATAATTTTSSSITIRATTEDLSGSKRHHPSSASFMHAPIARKARKVNSAGSCRSVLQN